MLGNKERLCILSSCLQSGATRTLRAVLGMRITWRLPGVMSDYTACACRSFDLMRWVTVVMGGCLLCGGFSMVMIVREQMLNVAKRSCQQPEPDAARRHDAETQVNPWLP